MTHRVFVANRGEIAVRILNACAGLGYDTVLGVSNADTATRGAQLAGRTVVIGGPRPVDSYLRVDTVVQAAVATGCDAVHPGYGFLSENPRFAELCLEQGLVFIGPSVAALRRLGNKLQARDLAESVGVPVAPGAHIADPADLDKVAAALGFPLLVKAAYGGGGRGIKLVRTPEDLKDAWQLAAAEAQSAFGDGLVFLEHFTEHAKHIEVQILGDRSGNVIHVGERECSVQFRYQKVIEEAPCLSVDQPTRKILHDSAVRLGRELSYVGLGTVEFLYDVDSGNISFLEVNPRVQVEHPVTEAVMGIDLIREQILVAFGAPLSVQQSDVVAVGHAIESRITAQDGERGLQPSPGLVKQWRPPVGRGIRLDTHMYEGYLFPPFYDALMGKLIIWGPDRDQAVEGMARALESFRVNGLTTSIPLLRRIVDDAVFKTNRVTTTWLNDFLKDGQAA